MSRIEQMRKRLDALHPTHIDIIDDSAQHAGHASANGGGHYRLVIVSESFKGINAVNRHREIYRVLGDMMGEQIHALSISAFTPEEF